MGRTIKCMLIDGSQSWRHLWLLKFYNALIQGNVIPVTFDGWWLQRLGKTLFSG